MARPVRCKRIPKYTTPPCEVRRTTHKPQPRPPWSRSGCLRGRRTGLLSHEGILALQRGEDVNLDRIDSCRPSMESIHPRLSRSSRRRSEPPVGLELVERPLRFLMLDLSAAGSDRSANDPRVRFGVVGNRGHRGRLAPVGVVDVHCAIGLTRSVGGRGIPSGE